MTRYLPGYTGTPRTEDGEGIRKIGDGVEGGQAVPRGTRAGEGHPEETDTEDSGETNPVSWACVELRIETGGGEAGR